MFISVIYNRSQQQQRYSGHVQLDDHAPLTYEMIAGFKHVIM